MLLDKDVQNFAEHMTAILGRNSYKGGWSTLSVNTLISMVQAETLALRDVSANPEQVATKTVDIANLLMMLYFTARNASNVPVG